MRQWTLLNWEPEALIKRYQKAGARLFLALANHHDGFDAWNSKHHAWNAQNIGPRRDVIGVWAAAARKQGLPFGVTVHAARNWWWFQVAHLCDKTGPLAGVPYDGALTWNKARVSGGRVTIRNNFIAANTPFTRSLTRLMFAISTTACAT